MVENNSESIAAIDKLISDKDYDAIDALFTDEYMRKIDSDELAYISLYVLIYREETASGIQNTSFNLGSNTQELIEVFRQLKFLLWEFEFDNNEESTQLMVDLIISKKISAEYLKMIVSTSSVNKNQVLINLSNIFS